MILNTKIINNAIIKRPYKFMRCKFSFILKRLSAFLLSFIIIVSSVFSQYLTAYVYGAEVGAIVIVDLVTELAISGGIVAQIFRSATILQGELSSGYGFGTDSLDEYANSVNSLLTDKVNSGHITNAQAGYVSCVDEDIPVIVTCPFLGVYQFLCTNELANKIRTSDPADEEEVRAIVEGYWDSIVITDRSLFLPVASDVSNWVTSLDVLDSTEIELIHEAVFNTFGLSLAELDATFLQSGKAGTIYWQGYTYDYIMDMAYVNDGWDYFVLTIPDMNNSQYPSISVMYHNSAWANPYEYVPYRFQQAYGRTLLGESFPGMQSVSISFAQAQTLGYPWTINNRLDVTEVFPGWGDLAGIESTDAIDVIDWILADDTFWNTDFIDLAIAQIAEGVDAKVDTGSTDIPIDLPIDIPVEGVGDIPFPGVDTEEEFDNPTVYPISKPWADVDVDSYPPFNPDPDDPDPDDPNPDEPDNPPVEPDEELPPLAVPQLMQLFPFCIPFDIHKALMFFETDMAEGGSPEFRIPFRIILPNNQAIIYDDIVINFDGYDIPLILYYIKAALVVTHCIVLGYATTKFIY